MVRRAAARLAFLGDRVSVQRADATDLPYADAAFDVVAAILVWHHVGDWRSATAEAHRVLRPTAYCCSLI
jgi:ubiquinone/menaquinone biosynthesis C-methylase UbiE